MENSRFKKGEIENLNDLNINEAKGWVIDETNLIEKKMNKLIRIYFNIKEPVMISKFEGIILHNSVIHFGAKIKILMSLNLIDKKLKENLHRIINIRNGFAHAIFNESSDSKGYINQNNELVITKKERIYHSIEVFNSNGAIESKNARFLFNEFIIKSKLIKERFNNHPYFASKKNHNDKEF